MLPQRVTVYRNGGFRAWNIKDGETVTLILCAGDSLKTEGGKWLLNADGGELHIDPANPSGKGFSLFLHNAQDIILVDSVLIICTPDEASMAVTLTCCDTAWDTNPCNRVAIVNAVRAATEEA